MKIATHKGKCYDVIYSVVNVSELEGELRIDAEYYEPSYLNILNLFRNGKTVRELKKDIRYGLYVEPNYVDDGINFIRALNLLNFWIEGEIVKIPADKVPQFYILKVDDIIIVRSGANTGAVCIVDPTFDNSTFGSYIIKISLKKNLINSKYFAVFLNSKYGLLQSMRLKTGSSQLNLNIPNIESFKIPIPLDTFQKFIEKLVLRAYEEKQKAEKLYKHAEEILLEELGLKNWKPKTKKIKLGGKEFEEEENISIRMLSEIMKADRMDAEYWEPRYDEFIALLKSKTKLKRLKEFLTSKILKGVEVGSANYQESGIPFIRVSNVNKFGIVERDQKYISKNLYLELRETYEAKKGEILLTKDATPGIAYVLKEKLKGIIASGIVRLKVERIEKEYLSLVINSMLGKMQIIREGGGSIISHWKPNQIKNLLIPELDFTIQQKISQLIQQSFKARENSKKLLEIAKRMVEIYIEKNEEEGLNYAKNKLNKINIEIY